MLEALVLDNDDGGLGVIILLQKPPIPPECDDGRPIGVFILRWLEPGLGLQGLMKTKTSNTGHFSHGYTDFDTLFTY